MDKQIKLYEAIRRNQTLRSKWFPMWVSKMNSYLEVLRQQYKNEQDYNKQMAIKLKADLIKKDMS